MASGARDRELRYTRGMSPVWSRRLLWVVLLLTLPVPMWFLGLGRIPTLALFQITAYLLPVWIREGGPGAEVAVQALGLQGLFWALVLYVLARIVVRLLCRLGGGRAPVAGVAAAVALAIAVSLFPIYAAPIIARGARVNLLNVY